MPTIRDNQVRILGVGIFDLGRDKAVELIDGIVEQGDNAKVGFANAHSLNVAYENECFSRALDDFIVLNDGIGVDIAKRIKYGSRFKENLNGTDFMPAFLGATKLDLRIYLIGSTDTVAEGAASALRGSFPRHRIVGYRNGFFDGSADIKATCLDIRRSEANCVLVGMGIPQQELWIKDFGPDTGARLFFGVGAFLDFQAGKVTRAPLWVRNLRCEWMFRLLQEPVRLARRYLIGNLVFLGRALLDVRGWQTSRNAAP